MTEPALKSAIAKALLVHYDLDLGNQTAEEIVRRWVVNYEVDWLELAAIEALYQGRYKAISVEQILSLWKRRGQPIYHFNSEFERLIRRHLPPEFRGEMDTNPVAPREKAPGLMEEGSGEEIVVEKTESSELPPAPLEVPEAIEEKKEVEKTPEESVVRESIPGSLKHTDFHSKLKSVADKNPKKSEW